MAGAQGPLFLERGTYRRRRMMDAIKLLALLGGGLWMIPVLWPKAETEADVPLQMSQALFYIFGVWLVLILLAALLVRNLKVDSTNRSEAVEDHSQEHQQ